MDKFRSIIDKFSGEIEQEETQSSGMLNESTGTKEQLDESTDFSFLKSLEEKAPPGKKAEHWIKSNKARFHQRYGKEKGDSILYGKAWNLFGK